MLKILNIAFPDLSLADQLRHTWITEAVLCSAPKEGGKVAAEVEKECRDRYLLPQLKLFRNARIVLLGGKAKDRLSDWPGVKYAYHPACRPRDQQAAMKTWERALEGVWRSDVDESGSRMAIQPEAGPQPHMRATRGPGPHPSPLSAADGWNRTYSNPNSGYQTEYVERALSDVPRTAEEIATIANLIYGKPGFVKSNRVTEHLTYHHLTLGATVRARRGDTKLRMPQLLHSEGGWSMPSWLRPK
jgi:hypothetical protein